MKPSVAVLCLVAQAGCGVSTDLGPGSVDAGPAETEDVHEAARKVRLGLHWAPGALRRAPEAFAAGASIASAIRTSIAWKDVQSTCAQIDRGELDWTKADRDMRRFAAAGVARIMTINDVPDCADKNYDGTADANFSLQPKPEYEDAFVRFVREVVERYGPEGAFWAANPELGYVPVRTFEIWNEPNFTDNWHARASDPASARARDYGRLFKRLARTIHGAAPSPVRVLTGGIANLDAGGNGRAFIRDLYAAHPDLGDFMDGMGVHTYSAGPDEALAALAAVRTIMNNHDDRTIPIIVTEHGWSTCPDPIRNAYSGKCVRGGEVQQARFLRDYVKGLRARHDALRVDLLVWFNIQDTANPVTNRGCSTPGNFFGLFRFDGSRKAALETWLELTGKSLAPGAIVPRYPDDRGCKLKEQG